MANASPTFMLKSMDTFQLKVELAIPPERPVMKGFIMVDAIVMSKDDIKNLSEENLEDSEYFDRIVRGIHGLADIGGNALEGDQATTEVKTGKLSMYLVPAIVQAYFEQYGEARRKNSKTSRSR